MDTEQLHKLLAEKKFEEAKTLITQAIDSPLSPEERGEALTMLASVYMKSEINLNEWYKDLLQNTLNDLEGLNNEEKTINNDLALKKVRANLN